MAVTTRKLSRPARWGPVTRKWARTRFVCPFCRKFRLVIAGGKTDRLHCINKNCEMRRYPEGRATYFVAEKYAQTGDLETARQVLELCYEPQMAATIVDEWGKGAGRKLEKEMEKVRERARERFKKEVETVKKRARKKAREKIRT